MDLREISNILSHPASILISIAVFLFSISLFYSTIYLVLQGLITLYLTLNFLFLIFVFRFFKNFENLRNFLLLSFGTAEKTWSDLLQKSDLVKNEENKVIFENFTFWIRYFIIFLFFPSFFSFFLFWIVIDLFRKKQNSD